MELDARMTNEGILVSQRPCTMCARRVLSKAGRGFDRCGAIWSAALNAPSFCTVERGNNVSLCGPEGKLWVYAPPKPRLTVPAAPFGVVVIAFIVLVGWAKWFLS